MSDCYPGDDSWRDPILPNRERTCARCTDVFIDDSVEYQIHVYCPTCLEEARARNQRHIDEILAEVQKQGKVSLMPTKDVA